MRREILFDISSRVFVVLWVSRMQKEADKTAKVATEVPRRIMWGELSRTPDFWQTYDTCFMPDYPGSAATFEPAALSAIHREIAELKQLVSDLIARIDFAPGAPGATQAAAHFEELAARPPLAKRAHASVE